MLGAKRARPKGGKARFVTSIRIGSIDLLGDRFNFRILQSGEVTALRGPPGRASKPNGVGESSEILMGSSACDREADLLSEPSWGRIAGRTKCPQLKII